MGWRCWSKLAEQYNSSSKRQFVAIDRLIRTLLVCDPLLPRRLYSSLSLLVWKGDFYSPPHSFGWVLS